MEGGTDKVTGEKSGESRNSVLPPLDQEASSRQPLESERLHRSLAPRRDAILQRDDVMFVWV